MRVDVLGMVEEFPEPPGRLGGSTPKMASTAFTEARWWEDGQIPQIRGVIRGASSTAAPMRNFSNPRSSMTLKWALSTWFWAFRVMRTWACPSSLVRGLIRISLIRSSP